MIAIFFFFFNDTATTEIYTLSLHDALPICIEMMLAAANLNFIAFWRLGPQPQPDRKSTRLNSSHANISYAVFCLKKKKMDPKHAPDEPVSDVWRAELARLLTEEHGWSL